MILREAGPVVKVGIRVTVNVWRFYARAITIHYEAQKMDVKSEACGHRYLHW